jgi:Protein of unknown function (DUF2927)
MTCRKILRFLYAFSFAAVLSAIFSGRGHAEDPALTNERILANLIEVVFGSEFVGEEVDFVRKWDGPMRIAIYAKDPARYRDLVLPHLQRLHELTGLDLDLVDSQSPGENAHILILGREQFYAYANDHLGAGKDPRTNSFLACYGFFKAGDGGRITEAFAVVPSFIGEDEMRSCVVEEVTQVMGLPNDSFDIAPSIFNDDDEYQNLTWQDELFLRVLYDPRIKSGMDQPAFEAAARRIIAELRPES